MKAKTRQYPVLILSRIFFEAGRFTCLGCGEDVSCGFRILVANQELVVCDVCKRNLERRP